MKILIFLLLPFILFSQRIEENTIDEFTGDKKLQTSWETLYTQIGFSTASKAYFRFRAIDSLYVLDFKLNYKNKIFSISEGDKLMLKFDDGMVLNLECSNYAITGIGDASIGYKGSEAPGIYTHYQIFYSELLLLESKTVTKFRVETSDGYIEGETDTNSKQALRKSAKIILDNL